MNIYIYPVPTYSLIEQIVYGNLHEMFHYSPPKVNDYILVGRAYCVVQRYQQKCSLFLSLSHVVNFINLSSSTSAVIWIEYGRWEFLLLDSSASLGIVLQTRLLIT